jgi:hypothetical protein
MFWDAWLGFMKMIAEYLEHAIQFETLASESTDAKLKASLLDQDRSRN